jgi:hypothetical protein
MKSGMTNCGLALLLALVAESSLAAGETEWLVAPYIWLPHVTLDKVSDGSSGGGGVSGSNLLDKIDAAGMIRIEAAKNRWGVTLDYIFLGLSDEAMGELPPPPGIDVNVRADVDIDVVELGGFYRPSGADSGVDYLAGFRNISVDETLLATPSFGPTQRFDSDSDFTDFFLGARYMHRFAQNWDFTIRGDYGFGDSEGSLNVLTSIGYRFNQLFALQLGYRYFNIEFEGTVDGAKEETEIGLKGPYLGFVFRFR